jgi:hypothetical protein
LGHSSTLGGGGAYDGEAPSLTGATSEVNAGSITLANNAQNYGAAGAVAGAVLLSGACDGATAGVCALGTPVTAAIGSALGGATGYAVGNFVDTWNSSSNNGNSSSGNSTGPGADTGGTPQGPDDPNLGGLKAVTNYQLQQAAQQDGYDNVEEWKTQELQLNSRSNIVKDSQGNLYAVPRQGGGAPQPLGVKLP